MSEVGPFPILFKYFKRFWSIFWWIKSCSILQFAYRLIIRVIRPFFEICQIINLRTTEKMHHRTINFTFYKSKNLLKIMLDSKVFFDLTWTRPLVWWKVVFKSLITKFSKSHLVIQYFITNKRSMVKLWRSSLTGGRVWPVILTGDSDRRVWPAVESDRRFVW